MAISVNETGTIKKASSDGNRICIKMFPGYQATEYWYSRSYPGYTEWIREHPTFSNASKSASVTFPFEPEYILILYGEPKDTGFILWQGSTYTAALSSYSYWCHIYKTGGLTPNGNTSINLSGATVTVTVDTTEDILDTSALGGLWIAVA